MVDRKFVLLKDLYPKFREEELSRCVSIPLEGKISPELEEILEMIAAHPQIFLNTGHVSPAEALRLIHLAKQFGIKKVLVASTVIPEMAMDEMKWAADQGAFLEITFARFTHTTAIPKTDYYVEK